MTPIAHGAAIFAVGLIAATIGSLAGLGGAFIAIPALRLLFGFSPAVTAGTSLAMVTANVASATVAFLRQGRVDLRLAALMGACAIPGSLVGVWISRVAPARAFDTAYAVFLLGIAADTALRAGRPPGAPPRLPWSREHVLRDRVRGVEVRYPISAPIVAGVGVGTGFVSSFFGVGGGVVTVPVLLRLFAVPAHIASATSHTIILISAPFGVAAQIAAGHVAWPDVVPLAGGALIGGQLGAAFSRRVAGPAFSRLLAGLLAAAACSLLWQQYR